MIELNIKSAAFIAVLLIATTFFVTRSVIHRPVVYAPDTNQLKIDSLTVAKDNVIRSANDIIDSLKFVTDGFRRELNKKDEVIASYSSIVGNLNLKVDSLSFERVRLEDLLAKRNSTLFSEKDSTFKVPKNEFKGDTVLKSVGYFGDYLLKSNAVVTFNGTDLSLHPPDIVQLRQPSIDVAVLLNEKTRGIRTVVTSTDFRDLKIETFTEIHPNKKRLPWFLIGIGAGVVGWEILR